MSFVPMIQSLEKVDLNLSDIPNYVFSNYANFQVYGFNCNIYSRDDFWQDSFRITDDYFYFRFYVTDNGRVCGVIDYCYNIKTQRFSYREIIVLTLEQDINNSELRIPSILTIEYEDIEIKEDGSFSTFDKDNRENAIVDIFQINKDENGEVKGILNRFFPIAKSENNEIAVFLNPEDNEKYSISLGPEVIRELERRIGSDFLVNESERNDFSHNVCSLLLNQYYKNGDSIVHRDPRNGNHNNYKSYEEYLSDSILELKNKKEMDAIANSEDFVVFNYKTCKSATLRTGAYFNTNGGRLLPNTKEEDLNAMGFNEFYNTGELSSLESFIKAHLEKCGVTDEVYITDYIFIAIKYCCITINII